MFSKQHVGSAVFCNGTHKGPRSCTTCCYMPHMHRVSVVLYSFHDLIWGIVEYDNV